MGVGYPYPIPGSQTSPYMFVADTTRQLGSCSKGTEMDVTVSVDYTKLPNVPTIDGYSAKVKPGGSPQLRIYNMSVTANILTLRVSGGIAGRNYEVSINVTNASGGIRTDTFNVNIDGDDCGCQVVQPVINNDTTSPDGSLFVNTAPRLFISATPPIGARVMDQWNNTSDGLVYSFVSDGAVCYWSAVTIGLVGPAGPQGPQGIAGPIGPMGNTGPKGAKGDTGAAGTNGLDGTNGTNGLDGNGRPDDNRIINGDMAINQRWGSNSVSVAGNSSAFICDRWQFFNKPALNKYDAGRNFPTSITTRPPLFVYFNGMQTTSAYTPLAADCFYMQHVIEADAIGDLRQGYADAQTMTISFWAYSSLGGVFSFAMQSSLGGRSYVAPYTLVANTWTKIIITLPGDVGGSGHWLAGGNAAGMYLVWDFGSGVTSQTPSNNTWLAGNYWTAAGQVATTAINGASWAITGVKLEAGSIATPFVHQSLSKNLADCMRYFQRLGGEQQGDIMVEGYASATGAGIASTMAIVPMCSAPTATPLGIAAGTVNFQKMNLYTSSKTLTTQIFGAAAGLTTWYTNVGSYIDLNAELTVL